jgi:hypothetical protein
MPAVIVFGALPLARFPLYHSPMRPFRFLLLAAVILAACQEPELVRSPGSMGQTSPEATAKQPRKRGSGETTKPPPSPQEEDPPPLPAAPRANAPLPRLPGRTRAALMKTHRVLDDLVDEWLKEGARSGTSLEDRIELWAVYQQRIYRSLGKSPKLARRATKGIPSPVSNAVEANLDAQRDLYSLSMPSKPPIKLPRARPAPAIELFRYFKQADRRFGVPWYVLASVNFIETRFGRLRGPSSAGAVGPMQFLPSTWARYGKGGDVFDPRDAIMGAARYLVASGAPADMRGALYSYNNSDVYVNAVLDYALQMRRDVRDFYGYYHWQVFVRTTKGDLQLTGPGKD